MVGKLNLVVNRQNEPVATARLIRTRERNCKLMEYPILRLKSSDGPAQPRSFGNDGLGIEILLRKVGFRGSELDGMPRPVPVHDFPTNAVNHEITVDIPSRAAFGEASIGDGLQADASQLGYSVERQGDRI